MAHNESQRGIPEWTLADRLRKIRRDRRMTQDAMAAALGVKPVTWSAWESGRTRPHDVVELAARIEIVFRVSAAWTLGVLRPPVSETAPPVAYARRWDDARQVEFSAAG